jgi:5-hydroxyisourate hydrolase-like protein (transthyretin family)
MRIESLFLSLTLITGVAAQEAPAKKPGKVEGVVTSTVTGGPVKKAKVTLRHTTEGFAYAALSDASGRFLFENVQPGTYLASANGSGFMAEQPGNRSAAGSKPISVAEEQQVKDVSVKLVPLGVISGHVLDGDGDPIVRANVMALRYFYEEGRKQLRPVASQSSNDLGEFQLIDLAPGRYYLEVNAQPSVPRLPPNTHFVSPEMAYPPTYYPNAVDVSQAKVSLLEAGSHLTDLNFRLIETPAFHIRGKIVDSETGQPARNVSVQVQTGGGRMAFNGGMLVQPDGSFDVRGLVSGSYVVLALFRQLSPPLSARRTVSVGGQNVDDVVLSPTRGKDILGTVTAEGPTPDSWKGIRLTLVPLDRMGRSSDATVSDSDGTFALHNIAPTASLLHVSGQIPGKYVKSIRFSDRDVLGGQIDLTQTSEGKIEIVFGSDAGQLQGTVQSQGGEPAVGALITLTPKDDGRTDLFRVATADQNGNYKFQDLAPGDYQVFAWQDVDLSMMLSSEFRKPFESKGASASVPPSGQATVQLKMISTEDVEAEKSRLP